MISHSELKRVLWLNEDEGRFYWNIKSRGIVIGQQAGSFDAYGYGQIRYAGKLYKEHRLVWFYINGAWPNGQIDHADHDRRNNKFANLREVNNLENHRNRPMQKNNRSGFVGVSFNKHTSSFESYITINGKKKKLGYFEKIHDAITARIEANKLYQFHKNHGSGFGISKEKLKDLTQHNQGE